MYVCLYMVFDYVTHKVHREIIIIIKVCQVCFCMEAHNHDPWLWCTECEKKSRSLNTERFFPSSPPHFFSAECSSPTSCFLRVSHFFVCVFCFSLTFQIILWCFTVLFRKILYLSGKRRRHTTAQKKKYELKNCFEQTQNFSGIHTTGYVFGLLCLCRIRLSSPLSLSPVGIIRIHIKIFQRVHLLSEATREIYYMKSYAFLLRWGIENHRGCDVSLGESKPGKLWNYLCPIWCTNRLTVVANKLYSLFALPISPEKCIGVQLLRRDCNAKIFVWLVRTYCMWKFLLG